MESANSDDEVIDQPLLDGSVSNKDAIKGQFEDDDDDGEIRDLKTRIWIETKKLWQIVGPSIFSRIATYSMFLVTTAFAGHLGDLQLAAQSIAINVIIGFSFGLLLGMASALETLCGQAFGAKRNHMLGIYLQRSWIVLFLCCVLLLPLYVFAAPILKLMGQTEEVAEEAGVMALWLIPLHFNFAFIFPLQRFLQSQLRTPVLAWVSLAVFVVHVLITWLFVDQFQFGLVGTVVALDVSWWLLFLGLLGYTMCGGCPDTWTGFSVEAFSGLWEFVKLSTASGVMLCLENWYYRILIVMTGNLKNAAIAVDALSICINVIGLEFMIPLAFLAATGVRVANELGAGKVKAAKFATIVSVVQSIIIGLFFFALILILRNKYAVIFTSSTKVLEAVDKLSLLVAFVILLNSVQPVLSGVAIGSGWQWKVAYINLGCYYLVGIPLGAVLGWVFDLGVEGIWGGMIFGGEAVETLILTIVTILCDWEKEAEKATMRVQKWSSPDPNDES